MHLSRLNFNLLALSELLVSLLSVLNLITHRTPATLFCHYWNVCDSLD